MAEPTASVKRSGLIRYLLLFSPSLFVFIIVVYPFLGLVHSFVRAGFFSDVLGNSPVGLLTRRAIYNSLEQGLASAVISFAVGVPMGLFLGSYRFRFRRVVSSIIIIPFFLPSIIVVFAFLTGFGPFSYVHSLIPSSIHLSEGFTGIVAVNTFFNAPLVSLFTMTAVEQKDQSLIEAANTLGAGRMRRFIHVWGKDGLLAGAGGALLTFTYSFAGFAAPLIIGGPSYFTMDAWIYFMVKTLGDLQSAIVLALMEAIILILPALAYIFFSSKSRKVTGYHIEDSNRASKKDPFFYAGVVFLILWLAADFFLLSSVIIDSFTVPGPTGAGLSNYLLLFSGQAANAIGISTTSAIVNTVFYGAITALLVVTLGLMWISGKRRLKPRWNVSSELLQYVPLIISSIIMAFSLSVVFGAITPASLVWVLIILAQSSVAIPVVLRILDSGFSSIPDSYSEAAVTLKGSPFFEVELPLARSTFATALMFGFAISMGEFSATNFLATASYVPLTVELYLLRGARLFGASYAAASILLIVSIVSFYIIQRLGERFVGLR